MAMDEAKLGEGAILSLFVTLISNVRIEFITNIFSYIEHDWVIENYITFILGVKCKVNILMKNNAYIGQGLY